MLSFSSPAFAQEQLEILLSPTPSPTQAIVYEMPYPGLLPDSPLYFLKTARDNVIGFLINDPFKKATFNLLQADKRFQAGIMLYQKDENKKELAFTTISKGHNYLEDAITKALDAKSHKVEVADLTSKIELSTKKQRQTLKQLQLSHPQAKEDVAHALERVESIEKKIGQLRTGRK